MDLIDEDKTINAKARSAKRQVKRIKRHVRRDSPIKYALRGFYWLLLIGIACAVLFVMFEMYKAYDQGKRQQSENTMVVPPADPAGAGSDTLRRLG